MLPKHAEAVILTADQALGTLRLAEPDGPRRVLGIDLPPASAAALLAIRKAGARIGLLVPGRVPDGPPLLPVDASVPLGDDLPEALAACAERLKLGLRGALFVAADLVWRAAAAEAGCLPCPHIALAALSLRGRDPLFFEARGGREQLASLRDIVPYLLERGADGLWTLWAAGSARSLAQAVERGLSFALLPLDLATEEPVRVAAGQPLRGKAAQLVRRRVLAASADAVLLALQGGDGEALDGSLPHGAVRRLAPAPELLTPPVDSATAFLAERTRIRSLPYQVNAVYLDPDLVIWEPPPSTTAAFQADVDRYSGAAALDACGAIVSRHVRHPGNARAVSAILADLTAMGYAASTHTFSFGGATLHNVVADLPGVGFWRIDPELFDRLRELLLRYPLPDPPGPWLDRFREVLGPGWLRGSEVESLTPQALRKLIEEHLGFKPWLPWWQGRYRQPGLGAQLVLIGCHLDSSASSDPGYDPATGAAPGADDDASGIAAVLAAARFLAAYRDRLRHTVRFCFFNAEEAGMVGSAAYTAMLKTTGAPVRAAVCIDMIGYNSDAARIFEVHAGYTDPALRDRNVPIAESVANWAASLGVLEPAQIYRGTLAAGGADRSLYDPAINRSDHASFHHQGYPAVAVSEDFFANMAGEPGADPNPHYHRAADTTIDAAYGSDLACAITYAVKELAA